MCDPIILIKYKLLKEIYVNSFSTPAGYSQTISQINFEVQNFPLTHRLLGELIDAKYVDCDSLTGGLTLTSPQGIEKFESIRLYIEEQESLSNQHRHDMTPKKKDRAFEILKMLIENILNNCKAA